MRKEAAPDGGASSKDCYSPVGPPGHQFGLLGASPQPPFVVTLAVLLRSARCLLSPLPLPPLLKEANFFSGYRRRRNE